jgi:hypothetical protein
MWVFRHHSISSGGNMALDLNAGTTHDVMSQFF